MKECQRGVTSPDWTDGKCVFRSVLSHRCFSFVIVLLAALMKVDETHHCPYRFLAFSWITCYL